MAVIVGSYCSVCCGSRCLFRLPVLAMLALLNHLGRAHGLLHGGWEGRAKVTSASTADRSSEERRSDVYGSNKVTVTSIHGLALTDWTGLEILRHRPRCMIPPPDGPTTRGCADHALSRCEHLTGAQICCQPISGLNLRDRSALLFTVEKSPPVDSRCSRRSSSEMHRKRLE